MPNFFNRQRLSFHAQDDGGDGGGGGGGTGGDGGAGAAGDGDAGGGGGDDNNFLSMLPEDIREEPTFAKFDSVDALGRSYLNLQRLLGKDKVVIPSNPDDQEAWNELYGRIGRPEKADGYAINLPEDAIPAEMRDMFDADLSWFKEQVHNIGLTQKQANDLYMTYVEKNLETVGNTTAQHQSDLQNVTEQMKIKYGDAYDVKMTLANRAIMEIGGEELSKTLNGLGMGRSQHVIEAFIRVGEMMAEDQGIDISSGVPASTPEDMDNKIQELQSDAAYLDTEHPKHNFIVNEVTKLMQKRFPEKPKSTF